jgi:transposase
VIRRPLEAALTDLARVRGRAPSGDRVIGTVQLGSWKTITFVAALRHNKMTTPMVLEGAMTGEMFLAYNCRVHMGTAIGAAIDKAHATLRSLPKYTPDLNPIELPYSKFKAFLRKVAARTVPDLTRAIPHSCHRSVRANVATISGMQAMLQYNRNPL